MVTVYTYLSLRSEDEDLLAIALLALGMTTVHDVIVGRALATTVFAHGALAAVVVGHAAVGPRRRQIDGIVFPPSAHFFGRASPESRIEQLPTGSLLAVTNERQRSTRRHRAAGGVQSHHIILLGQVRTIPSAAWK